MSETADLRERLGRLEEALRDAKRERDEAREVTRVDGLHVARLVDRAEKAEEALRAARTWVDTERLDAIERGEEFVDSAYYDDRREAAEEMLAFIDAALVGVEPPHGQPLVDPERPPDAVFDELRALHGLGSPGPAGSVVEDGGLSGASE